jgi:hypothetical protein
VLPYRAAGLGDDELGIAAQASSMDRFEMRMPTGSSWLPGKVHVVEWLGFRLVV